MAVWSSAASRRKNSFSSACCCSFTAPPPSPDLQPPFIPQKALKNVSSPSLNARLGLRNISPCRILSPGRDPPLALPPPVGVMADPAVEVEEAPCVEEVGGDLELRVRVKGKDRRVVVVEGDSRVLCW